MQKLSDITSKFKMTKFRVQMTAQAAIDVQKAMFVMGFRSHQSSSGEPRVADMWPVIGEQIHAFYIDNDCRLHCSGHPGTFSDMYKYREIAILEVFEASNKFAQLKRELRAVRKAEKRVIREAAEAQRKAEWEGMVKRTVSLLDMVQGIVMDAGGKEVDNDGYIIWGGGKMPVAKGTKVDVKYRDGDKDNGLEAGTSARSVSCGGVSEPFWKHDGISNDIVAYRLSKPELELAPVMEPGVVHYVEPKCVPMDITHGAHRPDEMARRSTDTNPKRQFGVSSVPLNMWSPLASAYGSLALYNGSLKYGKANFANTPVEASIYIAAAFRHLSAWASGQEFDPADGVPNLAGVLANVAILLESRAAGMLIDDRLKMDGYLKEIDDLKDIVKSLNVLHADKAPHHYTLGG